MISRAASRIGAKDKACLSVFSGVHLGEVGVQPFLARGRPFIGRPLLFWRLARGQPGQPAGPA